MKVETRHQLWKTMYGDVDKEAELAGTYDMPHTKPADPKKPDVTKTAELLKQAFATSLQPTRLSMEPHVDVTGKEAPTRIMRKEAQRYALPLDRRYPLDGYDQVKMASAYFDQHAAEMPFEVRRVFCQNMVPRAEELGISTSDLAQKYASSRYAGSTEISIAMDARRNRIDNEDHQELLSKVAAVRTRVLPEEFSNLLHQFDKMAGLTHLYGSDLLDPVLSTFGKTAAKTPDPKDSIIIGNEYVTARKIADVAKGRQDLVMKRFGKEFALEFARDPMGIFESLPRDQRLILMRIANSSDDHAEGLSV